jgi:hypothetical protein
VLSLVTGLLIPAFRSPRLALSAHLTGLLNVFVLTTLAAVWPHLLPQRRGRFLRPLFLMSAYTMWFGGVLGAGWGTTWFTPMASKSIAKTVLQAQPWQEILIGAMVLGTVLLYIILAGVMVWRLRPQPQ